MSRHSLPRIAPADLCDHADEARIARIWDRIERCLPNVQAEERRGRRSTLAYLAVAAALLAFGGGVIAGRATTGRRIEGPSAAPPTSENPSLDLLASGTQVRSFHLSDTGWITLSPSTMIELDRTIPNRLTLALLQGEASFDMTGTTHKALAIVAAETRLEVPTGGVLRVRRNADDLDVNVTDGTVNIMSPAGSQHLAKGEHADAVPLHTPTLSAVPAVAPHRAPPVRPRRPRDARPTAPKAAALPEWLTRYDANDYEGAFVLLKERDINATIDSARSAKELSAIAVVASAMRDRAAEIRANERLVSGFPRDQRASLAANRLANLYQAQGQVERARFYREQVEQLARTATDGSDSLVCNLIDRETDKTKAALLAKEYLDKYPDGECREKFVRMLQGQGIVVPVLDPEPSPSSTAP